MCSCAFCLVPLFSCCILFLMFHVRFMLVFQCVCVFLVPLLCQSANAPTTDLLINANPHGIKPRLIHSDLCGSVLWLLLCYCLITCWNSQYHPAYLLPNPAARTGPEPQQPLSHFAHHHLFLN